LALDAVNVIDVTTFKVDAGLLTKARTVTDIAKVILAFFWSNFWIHFLNTLGFKTRKTRLFSDGSTARMTTLEHFITRLLHEVEALTFSAHISECWLHTWGCLCELVLAKTAHLSIILITCFPDVVWLGIALRAKVFFTIIAPNSMVGHMFCCLLRNGISIVIFLALDNLAW
jgi:hypothetical protein